MQERPVRVPVGGLALDADLTLPQEPKGLVVFAHGSGSSRGSPRNRRVAAALQRAGLATLLLDLLSRKEEAVDVRTRHLRFDIGLLAERLVAALEWASTVPEVSALRAGLFGASTGGGASLVAAAARPHAVGAVVSRGGRPDLAGDALPRVRAPVLLVVGGNDEAVLDLNRRAAARMSAEVRLEVVDGAGHLFEEPGALDVVSELAARWFLARLPSSAGGAATT